MTDRFAFRTLMRDPGLAAAPTVDPATVRVTVAQRQVIAIVDDDALIRETLKDLLDSAGDTSVVSTETSP